MPRYVGDLDQVRPALHRARHEARAQAVAAEGRRIEAKAGSALLDDRSDVAGSQPPLGDALGALVENPAKDRSFGDAGGIQPGSQRRHGAGYLASRNGNPPAKSFLVRLRPAQRHQHALRRLLEVFDVERHELAPAESAGKAEKDDRPVAESAERRCRRRHGDDDVGGRGPLPNRRGADRPADPGEHRLHLLVAGRRLVAGSAVEILGRQSLAAADDVMRIAQNVQAISRRRRANARSTPQAKIRPGRPAPATGPGTALVAWMVRPLPAGAKNWLISPCTGWPKRLPCASTGKNSSTATASITICARNPAPRPFELDT